MASSKKKSSNNRLKTFALWFVIPYAIGYLFSHGYFSSLIQNVLSKLGIGGGTLERKLFTLTNDDQQQHQAAPPSLSPQPCERQFRSLLNFLDKDEIDIFKDISVVIHRNGEATSCGQIDSGTTFIQELKKNYESYNGGCPANLNKYEVESLLTKTLHGVLKNNACHSVETYGKKSDGFLGFCDMGEKHTPILLDHNDLVPVTSPKGKKFLPCRFHTREGLRITALDQLTGLVTSPNQQHLEQQQQRNECTGENASPGCSPSENEKRPKEIHLYSVPAGRVFMFAPSYIGEIFHLPHVPGALDKSIYLEVLSLEPRVFDVFNFFSREESAELVERAIAETSESHRIKRSTTGASSKSVNSRRTSESGFDTSGKTAVKVKKRCFKALGFDEYWESHGDGLQILRYNISKAYNSHLDWIEDQTGQLEHDYESGATGGNRFATILMYMSDLGPEDGGETVFPKAWPNIPEEQRIDRNQALAQLRESDYGNVLETGSWEEELVAQCRTRLSIRPHSSRAVLFYSQYPNGDVDPLSLHGACPVLNKQKYAANLWVWNTPRTGYLGAPIKEKFRKNKQDNVGSSPSVGLSKVKATFQNSGDDPSMYNAVLFYEDSHWGNLGPKDPPLVVNTYEGHKWNIKINDEIVKTIIIKQSDGPTQTFTI